MQGHKNAAKKLYDIADGQQGFFTTKQAKGSGFLEESHVYHVRMGNWIREHRGIYRLANYPLGEHPDLMLWHLWSCNRNQIPQGVYSHETALALHDLTDVNPKKLHMTVPKGFRRNSPIPEVLVLHFGDIPQEDIAPMHAVRVTSPIRTILDVVEDGRLADDLLKQAVSQASSRGLIGVRQLQDTKARNEALGVFMDRMSL